MSLIPMSRQLARRVVTVGLLFSLMLVNPGLAPAFAQDQSAAQGSQSVAQQAPPAGQQPAPPAGQPPAQGQTPPGPAPPPEKPFADVIKDAETVKGLFTLYRKDDKVWLEILPEQFDKIYLCSPTMESAIGERGFFASQVLGEFVFTLHKLGKNVQFLQKNVNYRATDKTPIQRAVARSFADSILGAAPVASLPHPERKSVLIELNGLLLADIPLIGYALEATYRWPYRLDARNSAFGAVKAFPQNIEVESLLNFAIESQPVTPLIPSPVLMPQASQPVGSRGV